MDIVERRSLQSRVAGWLTGVDPVKVGAAWVAFVIALPYLESQGAGLETIVGGGLLGLPFIVVGFLAAARCRPLPTRDLGRRATLTMVALLAGVGVGAANLGANVALASADPAIRALLLDHFAEPLPWTRVASVAVVEEIVSRLFVMSVVAWIASRFVKERRTVFLIALFVSAFAFAVPHLLGRPMPPRAAFAVLYASGVVVKSGAAGLVLGWIFWRWGLPYAIMCHFIANGFHHLLEPVLFS